MANSGKSKRMGFWALKIVLALVFLAAGGAKLAGAEYMVGIFDKIGIGQWFRIVTGICEVGGGILLLVPRTTFYGAALLTCVMLGAITAHLTVLGGNPTPAVVLLILSAFATWLTRPFGANARLTGAPSGNP